MDKFRKIQILLLVILIVAIGMFSYLMYSWNFAYSKGTLVTEEGTYTGEFIGKMFEGEGTFISITGVKYVGQWKDGDMEGYGVMTFKNGSKYEGGFLNGSYNGKGKITTAEGKVIEGVWKNGKLENTNEVK